MVSEIVTNPKNVQGSNFKFAASVHSTKDTLIIICFLQFLLLFIMTGFLGWKLIEPIKVIKVNAFTGESDLLEVKETFKPEKIHVMYVVYLLSQTLFTYNYENREIKLQEAKPFLVDDMYKIMHSDMTNNAVKNREEKRSVFFEFQNLRIVEQLKNKYIVEVYGKSVLLTQDKKQEGLRGMRLIFDIVVPTKENPYGLKLLRREKLDTVKILEKQQRKEEQKINRSK